MQVLMTRHTVMVVGKTSGGKSVVINTLARAQTRMGKRTSLSVMNPKVKLTLHKQAKLFCPDVPKCLANCRTYASSCCGTCLAIFLYTMTDEEVMLVG